MVKGNDKAIRDDVYVASSQCTWNGYPYQIIIIAAKVTIKVISYTFSI